MRNFYLIILFVGLARFSTAQTPYYYTLGEENGLPTSEVYQVKQDKFGFIWIGCDAGLFRYDGIHFKQYSYAKENGKSISELRFDSNGQLWCQNFTGQIFKVKGDSLALFKDFSKQIRVYPQYCVDHDGNVWTATEKYLEKLSPNGASLLKLNIKNDSVVWYDIEVNDRNEIFATSYQLGLCEIKKNGESYSIVNKGMSREARGRLYVEQLKTGLFLIEEITLGKKHRIHKYSNGKLNTFPDIVLEGFLYKLYEDFEGSLWLCTSNGAYKMNELTGDFMWSNPILKGDKISSFFQDREGNCWLTSLQNGIHIIPNKEMNVLNELNKTSKDKYVSSLTNYTQNELLAGTYSGGVYRVFKDTVLGEMFKTGMPYRNVKKIIQYKNGYFISRGRFGYNLMNKEIEIPALKNIRDFCVLRDTIYYTTSHTTGFFPIVNNLNNKKDSYLQPVVIMQKAGRSVACDTVASRVFFASNDGVYQYSSNKLKPIDYGGDRISAEKLVFENDLLWIATVNNGFITYNGLQSKLEKNINSVLKGKQINTFKISNGVIWVATELCLNKIDIESGTAEYYDLSDGLMSRQINDIGFMSNDVYLATNTGIIHFKSNTSSANKVPPQVALSEVRVSNQCVDVFTKKTINYNSNKISFKFISACFRARGKFFYKYRLIGLDTNWTIIPATNNEVIYASLPAGEFSFEVKAVNEDGVESTKSEVFLFTIEKPFWQEVWFYVVIAASGALLVYLISLSVIKNIRRKAEIKNDLISSKLTAIRAQMNPHFMYNTLNSIQDLILQSDIKNTNYYLSKFSSLMRKILEFSEKEKVFLDEEVEMLNDYLELEKLRFGDKFKYAINFEKEVETTRLLVPPMIIQPFIENAIKHGLLHNKGDQKLDIKFRLDHSVLICEITDNGVGRKRSEEIKARNSKNHPSFATQAIDKHMYLLNSVKGKKYSLQIIDLYEAEMAIGTKVIISIPI